MSSNVWGLNSPLKRTKCLKFLKRKEVSIALIQETHLKTTDIHRFQNRFYECVAHSSATNGTKGEAILFSSTLEVKVEKLGNDGTGRLTYISI